MSRSKLFFQTTLALAIANSLVVTNHAYAQEAENAEMEKIVVTSRGRVETLQQIPDSVTVINASEVAQARIETIKDFAALTPNLDVSKNFRSGLNFITVRGLITPQVGEAPIAYVVDGVTVPNLEFINQGLHNIERIEVLRGPQGALYGKNAIGGAVNIITKAPTDETEGSVQASYAQGNEVKLNSALSGAVIEDKLYYRISANYRDSDGQIDNAYSNEDVDFVDSAYGFQGMLHYLITDDTDITFRGNYSNNRQGSNYMARITAEELEDFDIENDSNAIGEDISEMWFLSSKLESQFDLGKLVVVLSANDSDIEFFADGDFTHFEASEENFYFPITQINPIKESSENLEVRFVSENNDGFSWALGSFAETKDRYVSYDQVIDVTPTELVTYNDVKALMASDPSLVLEGEKTVLDSYAYAFFGQGNYDITDDLELTFALRYDSETREAYDERDKAASKAEQTYSQLQPKASLAWQYTPDVLLYTTYSKGFRSGGFNEYSPTVNRQYDKEVSDTIEIGSKTTWLDDTIWLNLAAFRIVQQDAQFTRLNPSTFTLENLNIDEVIINGLELELSANVTEDIKVSFGAGYIDNEITENKGTDILSGRDLQETEGGTMPYVSKFNFNGSITHYTELHKDWLLSSRLAFNTVGPRSFDIYNDDTGETDSHTYLNANFTVNNESWSVSLFANNILDEQSPETVFLYNPLIRMQNSPRQVGVQAKYSF
ncbi:TonB-dependent receptor [Shewanella sp. MEBiC00475]|uniref:TonB-dependent receptor n=1 Tax=Shewanella sp. MEBiC00475 TaxID=2575361 RepID=UPI0010C0B69F|nr:TonB-dependent receptor [Shewanella sp. MEBiC00475]